jgi:hypothetical protein
MMGVMDDADLTAAHKHSISHRAEILASEICGCFHCLAIFLPSQIDGWVDHPQIGGDAISDIGETALCPRCHIDSVVGSRSGYPITPEFLKRMKERWF